LAVSCCPWIIHLTWIRPISVTSVRYPKVPMCFIKHLTNNYTAISCQGAAGNDIANINSQSSPNMATTGQLNFAGTRPTILRVEQSSRQNITSIKIRNQNIFGVLRIQAWRFDKRPLRADRQEIWGNSHQSH
jgi:hypothetical protein